MTQVNRRQMLATAGALGVGAMAARGARAATAKNSATGGDSKFLFCLNTSTVREQKLGLQKQFELAIEAGYEAIEPWIRDIDSYQQQGGSLADIKKMASDNGLTVASAIGFANWIVDDPVARAKGLEVAKHDMDLVKQIGGSRIAAPPTGATKEAGLDLFAAAERYHALLETGREIGVVAQLELWGFSKNLSRLGELAFVASEAGHPDACVLPDVYHIYKGGSDFAGLKMFAGRSITTFHMNDYPADPPRETINDAARVFTGDGIAPLDDIIKTLLDNGFSGAFSLELFNREYWKRDALEVMKEGLTKMKASVAKAQAS